MNEVGWNSLTLSHTHTDSAVAAAAAATELQPTPSSITTSHPSAVYFDTPPLFSPGRSAACELQQQRLSGSLAALSLSLDGPADV